LRESEGEIDADEIFVDALRRQGVNVDRSDFMYGVGYGRPGPGIIITLNLSFYSYCFLFLILYNDTKYISSCREKGYGEKACER
jgi:hypothetical protein